MRRLSLLTFVLMLVACSGGPVDERAVQTGDILEAYEFSDIGTFEVGEFEAGALLSMQGGRYRIQAVSEAMLWGLSKTGIARENMVVQVSGRIESGTGDAAYGVMCRADARNTGEGYWFAIAPAANHYYILRAQDENAYVLAEGDAPAGVIAAGENTIRGVCIGSYLGMYVNDVFLAAVEDLKYSAGLVGLAAAPGAGDSSAVATFEGLIVLDATFTP